MLLLLTAKWKLLGRGWSQATLEFKQGISALGQGSLAPLQGGCLWPWKGPVLHVASKEYVGINGSPCDCIRQGFWIRILGVMLVASDNSDLSVILS